MDLQILGAVARVKAAVKRRLERAKVDEAEQQQRLDDESAIAEAKKRLMLAERRRGLSRDLIFRAKDDIHVANLKIAELTAGIAAQQSELTEHEAALPGQEKEVAELRELLGELVD
jgi:hypothetical protein